MATKTKSIPPEPSSRTTTDVLLEEKTWAIWGYVRENRNSLDSERACKMIRDGFDMAVADVQRRLVAAANENKELRRKLGITKRTEGQP